ncbi:surfeit locus protein 6 homolog [Schistocerca cancellata]|uniref:surfeit locus protein 6 homolog n=1 Tax=Schistocerca cancellata TaxID=274614 RepID=UPI0021175280|nr:surfeit locus protein 6 homolog [Schistocerca cancellata]
MKVKRLDVPALRKLLAAENKVVIDLWKCLPIPGQYVQEDEGTERPTAAHPKKKMKFATFGEQTTRARSLQELHEKLDSLKGKRLVYKDKLIKKGLKNRLNKKRKKEENTLKKKLLKRNLNKAVHKNEVGSTSKPVKQIYNEEGKLVFNKFDFSESASALAAVSKKAKEPKDPRKILHKLEKQNEKLKHLESEGETEKAKVIKERTAWKTALQKAEGVKVKDDPNLLKKSVRKELEKKRKSKKKWDARNEKMKQQQQEKQNKRMENIQARKKQNKLTKLKKAAKKGRIIPGF